MSAPLIDAALILDDLNGTGQHGLRALYLEFFRFHALYIPEDLITQEYRAHLRHCVDLWLEHRGVLERRRTATGNGSSMAVTRVEVERAKEINQIVGRLAGGYAVLPAIRDDSYTFSIAPRREVMFLPTTEPRYEPEPPPISMVDPKLYPVLEDYAAALLLEQLAKISVQEPNEVRKDRHKPRGTRKVSRRADDGISEKRSIEIARNAAERIFMETLASDWRLRIAKCADSHCKAPYFRLGKVKTSKKAVLCHACRWAVKATHNQDRVEKNRKKAKRDFHKFAAKQFGSQILQDPAWYQDEECKVRMAEVLNVYIRNAGGALKSLYPDGITPKWFMSGQQRKNWKLIEVGVKRVSREASAVERFAAFGTQQAGRKKAGTQ